MLEKLHLKSLCTSVEVTSFFVQSYVIKKVKKKYKKNTDIYPTIQ